MLVTLVIVVVVVLPDRVIWNRMEHPKMLLRRLLAERRPWDIAQRQLGVRHLVQQVTKQSKPAQRLIVEVDQGPGCEIGVRRREHQLASLGVVVVMFAR